MKMLRIGLILLAVGLVGCDEEAGLTIKDCNFEESETEAVAELITDSVTVFDNLTLGMDSLADPFTIVIDDVERQFTHEEFKRRLGFVEEPNDEDLEILMEAEPNIVVEPWVNLSETVASPDIEFELYDPLPFEYSNYQKQYPQSYLTGSDLLFYEKLKAIEERLANLERFIRSRELIRDSKSEIHLTWPKDDDSEYQATNGVPICPYCKKPTIRTAGISSATLMYFQPTYNEKGLPTVSDKNITTTEWHCCKCGKDYVTSGNPIEGWEY